MLGGCRKPSTILRKQIIIIRRDLFQIRRDSREGLHLRSLMLLGRSGFCTAASAPLARIGSRSAGVIPIRRPHSSTALLGKPGSTGCSTRRAMMSPRRNNGSLRNSSSGGGGGGSSSASSSGGTTSGGSSGGGGGSSSSSGGGGGNGGSSYKARFWTWTTQARPSWRESKLEAAVIFCVFGVTGSTSVAVVRPCLKNSIGLEGNMVDGPWSYRILSLLAVSPIYACFLLTFGECPWRVVVVIVNQRERERELKGESQNDFCSSSFPRCQKAYITSSSSFPKSNSRDDQRQAHLLRSDGVENFRAVSSGDAIEALEAAGLPITTSI